MHSFIEKITVIKELTDIRQTWKVKHKFKGILFIVLVATIANADEWVEIGFITTLQHTYPTLIEQVVIHQVLTT